MQADARGRGFYIKGLDGIRAASIAMVFVSHLDLGRISPGMLGVNIFFLLSGFLITTLMIREHDARGRVSIREFYIRRTLRIFPPMYIVLAFGTALVLWRILPAALNLNALLVQCLHLTNYYCIYFDGAALIPGLAVYWSLAVEEHFCLIFPLVFVYGHKFLGQRRLGTAACGSGLGNLSWFGGVALVALLHSGNAQPDRPRDGHTH